MNAGHMPRHDRISEEMKSPRYRVGKMLLKKPPDVKLLNTYLQLEFTHTHEYSEVWLFTTNEVLEITSLDATHHMVET